MKLLGLVNQPDGYVFDESQNVFVPDLWGGEIYAGVSGENVEFATFSPETHVRRKLVSDEILFAEKRKAVPSFSGAWADEVRKREPQVRIAYRRKTYDDGSERIVVQEIENPDAVYIHKFRDDLYKVVIVINPAESGAKERTGAETPEDERWRSNLARARIVIEEYALCNPWQYFVTLTIDGEKLDRSNLETFRKKLQQMIRDFRRNSGGEISYLLVPELHPVALKNGQTQWHLHGLMNLPEQCLVPFENRPIYGRTKNRYPPKYIRDKLKQGGNVSYWKQYADSFGYSIVEPVQSGDASARYLMKYVSKEQGRTAEKLKKGQNLYYHSTGLKKSEKVPPDMLEHVKRLGTLEFKRHFENCVVYWYRMK